MKGLMIVLLSFSLTVDCYSQYNRKYSKKELKEIVRSQQRHISELLLRNEELTKLTARFHVVEQDMFNYMAKTNTLENKLVEKEKEIAEKNREKQLLLNAIVDYKKEISELKTGRTGLNDNHINSKQKYLLEKEIEINSYINKYSDKHARRYITGPRGGCYYINRNGNKTYVDRSLCE